jgi:hypothetical protein
LDGIAISVEEEQGALHERRLSRERLSGVRDAEIEVQIDAAREQFPKWPQRIEAAREFADMQRRGAEKARDTRDLERNALAETSSSIPRTTRTRATTPAAVNSRSTNSNATAPRPRMRRSSGRTASSTRCSMC